VRLSLNKKIYDALANDDSCYVNIKTGESFLTLPTEPDQPLVHPQAEAQSDIKPTEVQEEQYIPNYVLYNREIQGLAPTSKLPEEPLMQL
jgi:hypothetical protein